EQVAGREVGCRQRPQGVIGPRKVTWDEAGDAPTLGKPLNAPTCLAKKGAYVAGHGGASDQQLQVFQGHSATFQPPRRDAGVLLRGSQEAPPARRRPVSSM